MEMIGFPANNCGLAGGDTQDEATQHNRMRRFRCYCHSIYCLGCNEYWNNWYIFYFPVGHC